MAYTKQTWSDNAAGGTPISAARLNHMEKGIEDAHALIAELTTRIEALEAAQTP